MLLVMYVLCRYTLLLKKLIIYSYYLLKKLIINSYYLNNVYYSKVKSNVCFELVTRVLGEKEGLHMVYVRHTHDD